ncbi:MAG TPA: hypothetical protein VN706_12105 [Gemmatimonadaceae bacterium]|nr:hypothetical protein [Gemmatimonadaceae bacterium]
MRYVDPVPELKRQVGHELARLLAGGNTFDAGVAIGSGRDRR